MFGESAGGTLRLALRQAGRDDDVIAFTDDLSFGPIDPPAPTARVAWARSELYFPKGATAGLDKSTTRFWQAARSAEKRMVWFSRRNACEYCGFLESVSQLRRRSYEVVDLTGVQLPFRAHAGESATRQILGLAELNPAQVRESALWERAVPLSADERRRHRRSWQRLRSANAPFRVVEGDILVSAPIEIYDDMLLSCVPADWFSAARVIGDAIARGSRDPRHQAGDLVLIGRLRRLIHAGKVEARSDFATLRTSHVRLSQRQPSRRV